MQTDSVDSGAQGVTRYFFGLIAVKIEAIFEISPGFIDTRAFQFGGDAAIQPSFLLEGCLIEGDETFAISHVLNASLSCFCPEIDVIDKVAACGGIKSDTCVGRFACVWQTDWRRVYAIGRSVRGGNLMVSRDNTTAEPLIAAHRYRIFENAEWATISIVDGIMHAQSGGHTAQIPLFNTVPASFIEHANDDLIANADVVTHQR